jgi:hypothetical protein
VKRGTNEGYLLLYSQRALGSDGVSHNSSACCEQDFGKFRDISKQEWKLHWTRHGPWVDDHIITVIPAMQGYSGTLPLNSCRCNRARRKAGALAGDCFCLGCLEVNAGSALVIHFSPKFSKPGAFLNRQNFISPSSRRSRHQLFFPTSSRRLLVECFNTADPVRKAV